MSSVDSGEMYYIQFDQGRMAHTRRKPTGLVSNLPRLPELDGLRGGGSTDEVSGNLDSHANFKVLGRMGSRTCCSYCRSASAPIQPGEAGRE